MPEDEKKLTIEQRIGATEPTLYKVQTKCARVGLVDVIYNASTAGIETIALCPYRRPHKNESFVGCNYDGHSYVCGLSTK